MLIGGIIKDLRLKRGISQKDLVQSVGISQGYLSLIENGSREPSIDLIKKIASKINVPPELIFLLACDGDSRNSKMFAKPLKKIANAVDDLLNLASQ